MPKFVAIIPTSSPGNAPGPLFVFRQCDQNKRFLELWRGENYYGKPRSSQLSQEATNASKPYSSCLHKDATVCWPRSSFTPRLRVLGRQPTALEYTPPTHSTATFCASMNQQWYYTVAYCDIVPTDTYLWSPYPLTNALGAHRNRARGAAPSDEESSRPSDIVHPEFGDGNGLRLPRLQASILLFWANMRLVWSSGT